MSWAIDNKACAGYAFIMSEDRGYSFHEIYEVSEEEQLTRLAEREVPFAARLATGLLCFTLAAIWALNFRNEHWLLQWGVSWPTLMAGHYDTIWLHMFAHAGLLHLAMNGLVLWGLAPQLIARFGPSPANLIRFAIFYGFSGLAGLSTFLVLHPYGSIPMVGASGAICGLIGLMWRVSPDDDVVLPPWSRRTMLLAKQFVLDHLPLIIAFTLPALLSGRGGGVAWEAHLGGLLFGLLVGPAFLVGHHNAAVEELPVAT
jgi:membrane associated rhomboid family serine protease